MEPTERPLNWPACIEAGLLLVTATLLLTKVTRGVMVYYIHPRYNVLVVASAVVLLGIAVVRARAIVAEHAEAWAGRVPLYLLLVLPLLFGTFVPAQPLDADALLNRSLDTLGPANTRWGSRVASGDTQAWTLLDWASTLSVEKEAFRGAPVRVEGFVLRPPDLEDASMFYVARYVVTCCSADGAGVGLPVIWQNGQSLSSNTWIAVEGILGETMINGALSPAILAHQITPISQPRNPYLYPQ